MNGATPPTDDAMQRAVDKVLAAAPPLTDHQKSRLTGLLRPQAVAK